MANYYGTWTLFRRESSRFLKVYMQTVFAPLVSNLLFLAIFGLSLHRTVPMEGVSYLQFLVPGLIVMGIINNAYQNPSSSIILMKYQGTINNLLIIPLRKIEIFTAFICASILRSFIVAIVTFTASLFFVSFSYYSIPFIFLAAFLIAMFFSSLGLAVGIWAKEFDNQAFIFSFILTPLIFLGGIFFPASKLPGAFAKIIQINPIIYMIDLFRYGFNGIHEFPISTGLIVLFIATFLVSWLAYHLLKTGYQLQN